MSEIPWKLKALPPQFPFLLEMESRVYKTTLLVVDDRHHFEGPRVGRVVMKREGVLPDIQVGDRVLIRGSAGQTLDSYDKSLDEQFRFCRASEIEAVLPEELEVEAVGRR